MSKTWMDIPAMLSAIFLVLGPPSVSSAEMWPPFHKLGRGIFNVATGLLEVPKQAVRESRKGEKKNVGLAVIGVFSGLLLGTGYAVGRTLGGAVEIITFPWPNPGGTFAPLVQPETVFSDGSWLEDPVKDGPQEEEPF